MPSHSIQLQMQGYFDSAWAYIQQFADLHAVDKAREIKSAESSYTARLNCLEWLIRYHDYLSTKSSQQVLEAFKELIHQSHPTERAAYAVAKHSSDVMGQIIAAIRKLQKSEEGKQLMLDLWLYLGILELTLINDMNVESGIALGLIRDLLQVVLFCRSLADPRQGAGELKLSIRCLTYCFRNIKAIDSILDMGSGLTTIITLIQTLKDEEVLTNSIKILRVCLRSDRQFERVVSKIPMLLQILLQLVSIHHNSQLILEEATAAIRNYTRKPSVLDRIEDPSILAPIIKLAVTCTPSKQREFSIGALKNCCKSPALLRYFSQTPAKDILSEDINRTLSESRYSLYIQYIFSKFINKTLVYIIDIYY